MILEGIVNSRLGEFGAVGAASLSWAGRKAIILISMGNRDIAYIGSGGPTESWAMQQAQVLHENLYGGR